MTTPPPAAVTGRGPLPTPAPPPRSAGTVQSDDIPAVYARLDSGPAGLSTAIAVARLAQTGANELAAPTRPPIGLQFAKQFTDVFALLLLAAALVTVGAGLLSHPVDTGSLQLGVAILGVVILNAVIGFVQEYSAERTVAALRAMVPRTCRVLRDGVRQEIPVRDLVAGDVVSLEAGDAVPADCRLVQAQSCAVNNAALTGESEPARRIDRPLPDDVPRLEARNCLFMGTEILAGTAKAIVYATGTNTEFGRIFALTTEAPVPTTPLQHQIALMARRVSLVAVAIGALIFALRTGTGHPMVGSFVFALGVMVALVPEGLPATLSVSLAVGVRRMARARAVVKRLLAVEALGSTTVICTDKTGTLTQAEMTVARCWSSGRFHAVTGVGYAPDGSVEEAGAIDEMLRRAALCSNARLIAPTGTQGWRVLGDPTEGAILVAAAKAGVDVSAAEAATPRQFEFPFDSGRRLMSTVHKGQDGYHVNVKGAPQELVERCTRADWDGQPRWLDDEVSEQIRAAADSMARASMRVLAVGYRPVPTDHPEQSDAESELVFAGLIGMLDPPRPEVEQAVRVCRRAGIRMIMVTGDHALTAEAIARRVGIVVTDRPVVVRGDELARMSDEQLRAVLNSGDELLFCRVSPEHKMRVVAALEAMGEVVAVTGDGANDAPALKRADIGVAMGAGGTDVAREAAVIVLLDDSFATIVTAIRMGRSVYLNIRKFLIYLFSHNIAELAPILVATFVGFPLVPLTAVQILAIDLGSDVLPALALGTEPPEPDVMDAPPRSRHEPLFSWAVVRRFLFLGGIQSIGVIAVFFWRIHSAGIPFAEFTSDTPAYREAITAAQAAIVVSQFFNGLAVRTDRASILQVGLWSNPRLIAAEGLGIAIMAAISYLPPLQALFHTAPLRATDWLVVTGFGLLLLVAEELRTWRLRSRATKRSAG